MAPSPSVPLAPFTTLELGGPARWFVTASSEEELLAALAWAEQHAEPVSLLGGGSNLVVADGGVPGLVIQLALRGVHAAEPGPAAVAVTAQAGEPWDPFVARTVAQNLAGLECLSGIPGTVGATPIQNVGAYGQEVAQVISTVRAFDREAQAVVDLPASACGFGYRDSRFRREPGRFVVLAVTFRLTPGGGPALRYPELQRAVAAEDATLPQVREVVLRLRAGKSMVLDPADPNRRSVGSFFVNPVLASAAADAAIARLVRSGHAPNPEAVPRFPAGADRVKLSAAWLIEHCGFPKGTRRGAVGLSSRHSLALVHHGGGTTAELLAFAREIRDTVRELSGITLQPEPVFLGFAAPPLG